MTLARVLLGLKRMSDQAISNPESSAVAWTGIGGGGGGGGRGARKGGADVTMLFGWECMKKLMNELRNIK